MTNEPTTSDTKNDLFQRYVTTQQSGALQQLLSLQIRTRKVYMDWIIRRFLPSDTMASVLDLGAGYGAFVHSLREHGFKNVSGVELSAEMVEHSRSLGIVGIVEGDLFAVTEAMEPGSVDAVMLLDVLEHLTLPNVIRALSMARRVLGVEGRCIVQVPNGEGEIHGKILWGDVTHERAFTRGSIRQVMLASGFNRVDVFEVPPISKGLKGLVRRALWELLMLHRRLLNYVETGERHSLVSQNLIAVGYTKSRNANAVRTTV